MVCLDSDVLINFLRKDKRAISLFERLNSENKFISTTSINSFELLKGIPKSSNMDKSRVLDFLSKFNIYPFELNSSQKAADIFEDLKSKGDLIELPDIMIAAIAMTNGETLITGNISHFKRINGLKVEEPK